MGTFLKCNGWWVNSESFVPDLTKKKFSSKCSGENYKYFPYSSKMLTLSPLNLNVKLHMTNTSQSPS